MIKEMELWFNAEYYRGKPVIVLRKRITDPDEVRNIVQASLIEGKELQIKVSFLDPFKAKLKLQEMGYLKK